MAAGAVMVYSASSAESLLGGSGDPAFYLKRYLIVGVLGLAVMYGCSRMDLRALKVITPLLLLVGFVLTAALHIPGLGVEVNGATRWIGVAGLQFQPSELLKLGVVLYAVQTLAARPSSLRTLGGLVKPLGLVVAAACLLLMVQPDLGTAMVVAFAVGALLIAAGAKIRHLALIVVVAAGLILLLILVEPYRRERLFAFIDPWADPEGSGFQIVQSMIAIGSGGLFGVGLGESVQKIFYLPEAHTDMILAIVGEEVGVLGIMALVALYGMIAYAGLRAAKAARDRYSALLAAGITSLILVQASLNLFAVMGLAPLTGVPLPFMSYGLTNLVVLLAGMGLLLNVASGRRMQRARAKSRPRLKAIEGEGSHAARGDRRRRDGRARGSGPGRGRRTAG
jgi:cell division protein FtsW